MSAQGIFPFRKSPGHVVAAGTFPFKAGPLCYLCVYPLNMRSVLLLAFLLPLFSLAQQRIRNPDAVFSNNIVTVRFTITAGQYCNGYTLLHTADSLMPFMQVYEYPSICGEPTNDQQHMCQHGAPVLNQVNYYKIRLDPFEESPVLRVYTGQQALSFIHLYPNPCGPSDEILNLRFNSLPENTDLVGFVVDRSGVKRGEVFLESVNKEAQINIGALEKGVYVLWLTDGNNVFADRFLILD